MGALRELLPLNLLALTLIMHTFQSFLLLSFSVVFSQIAVLAESLRVVQLVLVLACPRLLRSTHSVVATHAHLLRVVTTVSVGTAQNLVFALIWPIRA